MTEAVLLSIGYLFGSVPTAYIVGRFIGSIDVRDYGSGNLGASNVWVQFGKVTGFLVGIFDILVKGTLPVIIAMNISDNELIIICVGLAAVIGHNWSIYMKFSGGRGIAVAAGALLALYPPLFLISFLTACIGHLILKNGGMWVGIALIILPAWAMLFGLSMEVLIYCLLLLPILAVKRLFPGSRSANTEGSGFSLYINRLIYDRDTASREDWISRSPLDITKGD